MPIYEYECGSCGEPFEERVRMGTPDAEVECPRCGARAAKRLPSIFAGRGSSGQRSGRGGRGCGPSGFG